MESKMKTCDFCGKKLTPKTTIEEEELFLCPACAWANFGDKSEEISDQEYLDDYPSYDMEF